MEDLLVNSRPRIFEDIIHIKRRLVGTHINLNVAVGEEISPDDLLGSSETSAGFVTVNLASELKQDPKSAFTYLKRRLGENIYEGELLAEKALYLNLSKKILISPGDGVLDFYDENSGVLRIKLIPKKQKLISGVYGIVEQTNRTSGEILIRTLAKVIFGLFGSGMERSGVLKVLGNNQMLVSSNQLSSKLSTHIVVGGSLVFLDALQKAFHLKIAGVITGGINAVDFKAMKGGILDFTHKNVMSDIGVGVIVTEGFGTFPIGEDLFKIFSDHNGKFAILQGNLARVILPSQDINSMISIRQARIPSDKAFEVQSTTVQLEVGSKVRIIYSMLLGIQGVVSRIDRTPTLLPSGVTTVMTTVRVGLTSLRVPYNNLEVIT